MSRGFKWVMVALVAVSVSGCANRRMSSRPGPVPTVAPPQPVFPGGSRTTPGLPPGAIPAPPGSGLPAGAMIVPQGGVDPAAPLGPATAGQPFPTAPGPASGFPVGPPASAPPGPSAPPGASVPQGGFPVAPQNLPPPAPPTSGLLPGSSPERVGYRWQPSGPAAPIVATVPPMAPPVPPAPPGPSVLLLPPQPDEQANDPTRNRGDTPRAPVQLYPPQNPEPSPSFPVGIAGFDRARETLATGQRPSLEGLDWLAKQGYRRVVFLHLPGERIDTDREQVEKRGMTFIPLPLDPRMLSAETVQAFLQLDRDRAAGKAFVYDLDGSLTGPMWYLTYRLIDQDLHEVALIRARQVGLREERDGAFRDMWQAVRRYLQERGQP